MPGTVLNVLQGLSDLMLRTSSQNTINPTCTTENTESGIKLTERNHITLKGWSQNSKSVCLI